MHRAWHVAGSIPCARRAVREATGAVARTAAATAGDLDLSGRTGRVASACGPHAVAHAVAGTGCSADVSLGWAGCGPVPGARSLHVAVGTNKRASDRDKLFYTRVELPSHQTYYDAQAAAAASDAESTGWTPDSRRVGAITLKCGMTADWDVWGQRHPLTVLKLEDVRVTQVKDEATHGYTSVQVGGGDAKPKNVSKPQAGHFARAGVEPKAVLAEFRVSEDAVLPVGTPISVQHFVPGQYVDVTSTTIGKGFQGPMKRWGFGGQKASHGTTKAHRSHGSTGSSQNPGRVFKGKKMAGRMGGKTATVECLQVYKVDIKRGLLYLRGSVPGHAGAYVRVRDSLRKPHSEAAPPPFPTFTPSDGDAEKLERWAAGSYDSPQEVARKRSQGERFELEPPFEVVMPAQDWDPFGIHDWEEPTMD